MGKTSSLLSHLGQFGLLFAIVHLLMSTADISLLYECDRARVFDLGQRRQPCQRLLQDEGVRGECFLPFYSQSGKDLRRLQTPQ
jgi:hypothetical protein